MLFSILLHLLPCIFIIMACGLCLSCLSVALCKLFVDIHVEYYYEQPHWRRRRRHIHTYMGDDDGLSPFAFAGFGVVVLVNCNVFKAYKLVCHEMYVCREVQNTTQLSHSLKVQVILCLILSAVTQSFVPTWSEKNPTRKTRNEERREILKQVSEKY